MICTCCHHPPADDNRNAVVDNIEISVGSEIHRFSETKDTCRITQTGYQQTLLLCYGSKTAGSRSQIIKNGAQTAP